LERAVALAVLAVAAVILIVLSGVCVFAIQKMKPDWLRIHAGAGRAISFGIEIGRSDRPPADPYQQRDERRELEAGRDKPRELEAGPEPVGLGPSDAADPDNAAVLCGLVSRQFAADGRRLCIADPREPIRPSHGEASDTLYAQPPLSMVDRKPPLKMVDGQIEEDSVMPAGEVS
jgi:hypothetical protein